jgi:hypothetical protein
MEIDLTELTSHCVLGTAPPNRNDVILAAICSEIQRRLYEPDGPTRVS